MYRALWDRLPGPLWLRLLLATALVASVLILCATVLFPLVDGLLTSDATLETG